MIAPGAIRDVQVQVMPDGSARISDAFDAIHCLAMFARSRYRLRPSIEGLLDQALLGAMEQDLKCRACRTWTRHRPDPTSARTWRCAACEWPRAWPRALPWSQPDLVELPPLARPTAPPRLQLVPMPVARPVALQPFLPGIAA